MYDQNLFEDGSSFVTSQFETNLDKNPANFQPLTPLSFIERTATTYPDRTAVIHGNVRRTWGATYARCRRLASALENHGIQPGETVAAMLPNARLDKAKVEAALSRMIHGLPSQ